MIRLAMPVLPVAMLVQALLAADAVQAPSTEPAPPTAAPDVAPAPVAAPAWVSEPLLLPEGGSTVIRVDGRVQMVAVAQPAIADARPISDREVLVVARAVGSTDLLVKLDSGASLSRRVRVTLDKSQLESTLSGLFGQPLEADDLGGTVAVRGTLPDVAAAALLKSFMDATGMKWVDLTRIAGVQQVQLRVRIAEASRTALRELAFGAVVGGDTAFGGIQAPGGTPFQPVSISPGLLAPASNANFTFANTPVTPATTLFGGIPGANLEIFLKALSENRYVRVLAEPNLVAVSGEQATFLVGGEFPIPIVQGSVVGGGSTVTVEYKEFGVRLNFRPQVLGSGRIRLEVAPEVSELSEIGAVVQNGFTIPGVTTRRSQTTVELGSGQSFAMAGLLRTKDQARVSRVPLLGDIPVLGVLFRGVRYEQDQTELVVMITAELVEPLDDGEERPMPGDLHEAPNDWELFIEGSLNGSTNLKDPLQRLRSLGLKGLKGPGAWKRPEEPRQVAADPRPMPVTGESGQEPGTS
ncbi:MAG: type II and III secretion system protein family protein [Phycisphaerales bacterium]|jgi:pilus assembly protein CpaC